MKAPSRQPAHPRSTLKRAGPGERLTRPGYHNPILIAQTEKGHVAGPTLTAPDWGSAGRENAKAAWRQADLHPGAGRELKAVDVPVQHQRRDGRVAAEGDAGQ